jgi:hypothetical protein
MIALLIGAAMAAATPTAGDVRALVREQLKDPQSAQFSGVRLERSPKGGWSFCGYVNARNSYGGYAGRSFFIGSFPRRNVVILDPGLSEPDFCE